MSNNTVVECIFNIHFESSSVAENYIAIIGQVDEFEQITKLPLCQIPDSIRKNDPNLKMEPLYEITSSKNSNYKVMLGDNVIGIVMNSPYTSWTDSFFPQLKKLFIQIFESKKITRITRMGLRYIDFIENKNIFETGKIKININDISTNNKKIFLRVEGSSGKIQYNKIVANNEKYQNSNNKGSIIDIVTSVEDYTIKNDEHKDIFKQIDRLNTANRDEFKEVVSDEEI
ncbi:MAG: TIGR04255 family protein [Sulfurospirillum sp.]|nr:TIGR04255 family protein [Sulfurospirillum sp.]MBL0702414.1 TIGR04255 family protein [Sulfurospirillum sp.]